MSPRLVLSLTRLTGFLCSRRTLFLLGSAACLLGLLFFVFSGNRQPSYQHISASDWLELARTNQTRISDATAAFTAMGPAGAEFLGEELLRRPSRAQEWFLDHHSQIPNPLKPLLLKPQPLRRNDTDLKLLEALGTNAAPAVPFLITWLESSSNVVSGTFAAAQGWNVFTNASNPGTFWIQTATNGFTVLHAPGSATFVSRTQTVILAPGRVATNVVVTLRYASNTIPLTAYRILTNLGSSDSRIIPILLRPTDRMTREFPAFGTNLKTAVSQSIPLLIRYAESGNAPEKVTALSLLKLTLPESKAVQEVFIRRLEQHDVFSREIIIGALSHATNDVDRIVPFALEMLLKQNQVGGGPYYRGSTSVFTALKEFSRYSPRVIPGLQETLPKASTGDKIGILQLLGEIGNSNNVDPQLLKTYTTHYEALVRTKAWFALGAITGDTDAQVNEQLTLMEYGNDDAICNACAKLASLGPAAKNAVPSLRTYLKHQNDRVIAQAIEALGKIGPSAKAALPDLEPLLKHARPQISAAAETAMRKISAEQE